MYADDQNELDRPTIYCENNFLFLNIKKCHSIPFSMNNNIMHPPYFISNEVLPKVAEVKDLEVYFDS